MSEPKEISIKSANFIAIPAGTKLYRFNTRNSDAYYALYKDDFLDNKGVPRGECWQELDMPREFMLSLQGNSIWDARTGDSCITEYVLHRSVVAANRFSTNDEIHRGTAGHYDVVVNDHDDSIELAFLREASDYVRIVRDISREEYDALPDRKYLPIGDEKRSSVTYNYMIMLEAARMARFNTFDNFMDAIKYLWTLTDMYSENRKPKFEFSKHPLVYRRLWSLSTRGSAVQTRKQAYDISKKAYDIFMKYHGDDDDYYAPILKQAFETEITPLLNGATYILPLERDIIKYDKRVSGRRSKPADHM